MVFKQILAVYSTEVNYRQHLELRNSVSEQSLTLSRLS